MSIECMEKFRKFSSLHLGHQLHMFDERWHTTFKGLRTRGIRGRAANTDRSKIVSSISPIATLETVSEQFERHPALDVCVFFFRKFIDDIEQCFSIETQINHFDLCSGNILKKCSLRKISYLFDLLGRPSRMHKQEKYRKICLCQQT